MEERTTTEVQAETYEPPRLVEAGEFAEVTLGPPWGRIFDAWGLSLFGY